MLSSRLSAGEGINRDVGLAPFKHCMSADCECGYGICMLLYLVLHTLPCVYRNRPAHTKCATTMKKKKFFKKGHRNRGKILSPVPPLHVCGGVQGKPASDLLLPFVLLLHCEAEGFLPPLIICLSRGPKGEGCKSGRWPRCAMEHSEGAMCVRGVAAAMGCPVPGVTSGRTVTVTSREEECCSYTLA